MDDRPKIGRSPTKGSITLNDEQRLNWLRLIRSENVGPATFRDLINHFRSAGAALEGLPELMAKNNSGRRIKIASRDIAEREMDTAQKCGARFIGMGEPEYPSILRNIDYPPPLLCVRGNTDIFKRTSIAIVGSRNASISGTKITSRFASELGQAGVAVVSGLARGIDTSAHRHSLVSGTVAVFAGGIDKIFPEENHELANAIIDNDGLLVSEMPVGWQPRSQDFPKRNRLIAGLCEATLVIEAAKRSGSLISARLANEAGRSVFAIPGSPLDPRSEGANWLIKQGATLVTNPQDIIDDLLVTTERSNILDESEDLFSYQENSTQQLIDGKRVNTEKGNAKIMEESDEEIRTRIINALGPSPVEIDDIIRFANATPGQVQMVIVELSLAGKIERHSGNRVSLI
ncbi:MAG: DNA-protecting protein DprA [Hyphomicrobiales bacterium]|nr:DNA-protecting protein DprA [Hyphomicrobiales bacterium]PCH49652.1 MAG: DNA-protecting protein DprA [Hyphomicrobiales bacterium]